MSLTITQDKDTFILENKFLSRRLRLSKDGFYTDSLLNRSTGTELCSEKNCEFSFRICGTAIRSLWKCEIQEKDGNQSEIQKIPVFQHAGVIEHSPDDKELKITFSLPSFSLTFTISYRIFSDLAGIIKQLTFTAENQPLKIDCLTFDSYQFQPGKYCDCIQTCGGSSEELPPCYCLENADDTICCWNPLLQEGYFCGTSAPGPLRQFLCYPNWGNREISYTRGCIPFTGYLQKNESFTTDQSLLLLFQKDRKKAESDYRRLIRMILPPMPPPGIMFCTWLPFLKNISEELVLNLARQTARLGGRFFVLDDGWFTSPERQVDLTKFPRGLKNLSDRIHDMGLQFGLWYNIGTSYGRPDTPDSQTQQLADGSLKLSGVNKILCWGDENHRQEVLRELSGLAEQYQVNYFKLDFSSIISPYGVLPWGCHSSGHAHHQDFQDSIPAMYQGFHWLRTELKKRFPDLLIDFSFECFGPQNPSIAAIKYSDLNHISNYSGQNPELQSISRIRRTFYRWFSLLPPERLLGGLLTVSDYRPLEYLLTAFIGAPLISGNILKLSDADIRILKKAADAFNKLSGQEPLTELEVPVNETDLDCFVRRGNSGHGFLCAFNRRTVTAQLPVKLPYPCGNVFTGSSDLTVPPESCTMFVF